MITEIYPPIDEMSRRSLEKVQTLLDSEVLLSGLGIDCASYPVPANFPLINDLDRSYYLISSQQMWDEEEEDQDQYFEEINGEAIDRYNRYPYKEVLERQKPISKNIDAMSDFLYTEIKKLMDKHKVVEHLSTIPTDNKEPLGVKNLVENVYANSVAGHFMRMAESAFFGGIESWPIVSQYYACFLTGGIPTGWVGKLPSDGGVPQECMQLLHFGPQEKTEAEL